VDEFRVAFRIVFATIIINFVVIGIKIYLYTLTMSIAVLAYLVDSLIDLLNDILAMYSTRLSSMPEDADHPYGHTKYDAFFSIIISSLILVGSIEIFRESAISIIKGGHTVHFDSLILSLFFVLMSIYTAIAIVEFIYARRLGVATMSSSALHYITDPLFSFTVLLGVYFSYLGFIYIDYILSVSTGILLTYLAIRQIKRQTTVLVDAVVFDPKYIRQLVMSKFPEVRDIHEIRSRTDGFTIFLEFHLLLDPRITLKEAHDKAHEIQDYLQEHFGLDKKIKILIHTEPS